MATFRIAHLYPDLMNLYGDRGNLICLQKRLEWYGHDCVLEAVSLNGDPDYKRFDMIFMGGGSDREQGLVYQDLLRRSDRLWAEFDGGMPALCICGAYQLLGQYYESYDGIQLKGLGFFNFITRGQIDRLIGNVIISSSVPGDNTTIVGFENHGGRTYLSDERLQPFGTVINGFGNNGQDKTEGMCFRNLIGTYLHGPLLPKNPAVADFFIHAMANRKGAKLNAPLDDQLEHFAHQQVISRVTG